MKGKMGDMAKMAKDARNLKSKVKKAEKELKKTLITGISRDETVKAVFDGKVTFRSIQLDPELVSSGDVKKIEKNIAEAIERSVNEAHKISERVMGELQKDVHIPGLTQ